MPGALLQLLRLQWRGFARRSLRGARTPRRMVMFALGALILLLYLGPSLFFSHRLPRSDPQRVRTAAPFALLGICVLTLITSAGDRAISFTPGEIDMLFPGPFTRRQLIVYKLAKSTFAAMLSALFLSVVLHRHARWWPACYLGVFLSLLFVQFFSINAVIITQTLGTRLRARVRLTVFIAALSAGVLVARQAFAARMPLSLEQMMRQVAASDIGHLLLMPFSFFGEAMTAPTVSGLFYWGMPALVIDIALLGLLLMLDANYLEAASVASERRYAQLQRIRGGSFLSIGMSSSASWQVPHPPFLGGAGPIVWRQITGAARSSKGLLFLLLILAVGAAPLAYSTGRQTHQFVWTFATVAIWMTLLVSTMLKFDFRGDLDLMDTLKSLPLRPWALAAGQLLAPALLLSATHFCLLAVAVHLVPHHSIVFVCAAILVLPLDLLLFAVENLLFLLYPTRPAAASPGDFQILGRQALVLAGKMMALTIVAAPPFAIALLVWIVTAKSAAAFTIVAATLVVAEVIALIPLIGWAFVRFDPSIHTPA
jgi:hypothetical protein